MRLLNYREGFASNSSSTHFTHFNNDMTEQRAMSQYGFRVTFSATGKEELLRYVGAQINANLDPGMDTQHRKFIIDGLIGIPVSDKAEEYAPTKLTLPDDHVWKLPRAKGDMSNLPNPEFVNDIIAYVLSHNRMILEWEYGNVDNPYKEILNRIITIKSSYKEEMEMEYDFHRDLFERKPNRLEYLHTDDIIDNIRYLKKLDSHYCLKEDGVWKFFNKENGKKMRFTFDSGQRVYKKSTTPELIDLIISNKCSRECSYCHRDCTKNGKEADLKTIKQYIYALATTNIFEIVIGGGDILEYHSFEDLMAYLSAVRKVSDTIFTTTIRPKEKISNSYWSDTAEDYMKKAYAAKLETIAKTFSGVEISVDNGDDLIRFINNYYRYFLENNCQVTVQIIPEATRGKESIDHILRICDDYPKLHIVLLGFKRTGRASAKLPGYMEAVIEELQKDEKYIISIVKHSSRGIGMDTQFIKNFPFLKKGMKHWEYTTREGAFSCCIDAIFL